MTKRASPGPGAPPDEREERRKGRLAEGLIAGLRERLHAGRLEEAFRIGEWLLDSEPAAETYDALLAPFERIREQGRLIEDSAMYDLLEAIRALPAASWTAPWRTLIEVDLLHHLSWNAEAFAASRPMLSLSPRYAWMRHNRGTFLLGLHLAYEEARREFRAVLDAAPAFWKSQACLAECALCLGDDDAAFGLMDDLVRRLGGSDRAAALGWRGELRLWRGSYEAALADLDEAISGRSPLAACWRGGALLRLGRAAQALETLDAHLALSPGDLEGRVWRGEARRLLGRSEGAIEDLDLVVRAQRASTWALVNRALARAELGDVQRMREDYTAIERVVRSAFEWKLRAPSGGKLAPEVMRAVLEAILAAGKGVRRGDAYLFPLWLTWTRAPA